MPHPQRRTAIIAITLFFIGVSDMSNHANSFEDTQTGAAPEGWTSTLTIGRSELDGRKRRDGAVEIEGAQAIRPSDLPAAVEG